VESGILGRVPVVSNNNWLSFELSKHQLGGLTFDLGSSVDIQTAIAGVVANYEFWRSRLRLLQTNWIAFHSASSLVRVLLEHFMYVNSQLPVSDEAFP
jgi:hypothetical protein